MVMKMEIDFKGYKYVIIKRNGFHNRYTNNEVEVLEGGYLLETYRGYLLETYLHPKDDYDLHTNPDYKDGKYDGEFLAKTNESKEMIYTQAMKLKGEAPKVGMDVLYNGEKVEVINIYHIGDSTVLTLINNKTSGVSALYFNSGEGVNIEVIDARTDIQKAMDDISEIRFSGGDKVLMRPGIEAVMAAIRDSKIHGVSFTGDKK